MKTCVKCHTEYPATSEFFHREKRGNDGDYTLGNISFLTVKQHIKAHRG